MINTDIEDINIEQLEESAKKKVAETKFKERFKEYLEAQEYVERADLNEDGVDVVATLKNGEKRYFELMTSSHNIRKVKKYFGAMSQVEWECAFAHPEHFYMVQMWDEEEKNPD